MTDLITCATCGHDKSWHEGGPTGHSPIDACTYTGCECQGFRSGDIADEEGDVEAPAYNPTPSMPDAEPHNDEPPYEPPPYDWEPGGGSSGGGGASGDV